MELPVEAQAEPAAVADVRRAEEPLGVGLDEHLLDAVLGRRPQANRPSPWWSFRTIANERLSRTKKVG